MKKEKEKRKEKRKKEEVFPVISEKEKIQMDNIFCSNMRDNQKENVAVVAMLVSAFIKQYKSLSRL